MTPRQTVAQASWMSQDTWRLDDRRAVRHRTARASAKEVRQARRKFQRSIQANRQQRVQEAGATIDALMEYGQTQEAWGCIPQWYLQGTGRQPPPHLGRDWTR